MRIVSLKALVTLLMAFIALTTASSCKKRTAFKNEDGQVPVDNRSVQGENDEALKDVNIAITEQFLMRGRTSQAYTATTSICGAAVDTTGILTGVLKLNFKGENCFGRSRSGAIRLSLTEYPLKKWKHASAVIKMEFLGYKVTRSSDGRSVQLDGVQYLTNLSGGSWFDLWFLGQPSVVYKVEGSNIKATFDGDATALFNFSRQCTFTYSSGITTCRVEGTGSQNGVSHVQNWGETRDGKSFTSEITKTLVWSTRCGAIAPLAGQVVVRADGKYFDLVCDMGTNGNGDPQGENQQDCPYGFKMTWKLKRRTNILVFSYY